MRFLFRLMLPALMPAVLASAASAQGWKPTKDVEFVIPFGIRSVLGFGGMLPSGNVFAVILFAQIHVPRDIAEFFKTLADAKLQQ